MRTRTATLLLVGVLLLLAACAMRAPVAYAGIYKAYACGNQTVTDATAGEFPIEWTTGLDRGFTQAIDCPGYTGEPLLSDIFILSDGCAGNPNTWYGDDMCWMDDSVDGAESYFDFRAPPGTAISNLGITRSYRTQIKPVPGKLEAYQFRVYGQTQTSTGEWRNYEACGQPNTVSANADIVQGIYNKEECLAGVASSEWGAAGPDSVDFPEARLTGGVVGGRPVRIRYKVRCYGSYYNSLAPGKCLNFRGTYVTYPVRLHIRSVRMWIDDYTAPGVGGTSPSWNTGCWYRSSGQSVNSNGCFDTGSFNVSAPYWDNTGIKRTTATVDGGEHTGFNLACKTWPGSDGPGYSTTEPCTLEVTPGHTINGWSLGTRVAPYQIHTTATDAGDNTTASSDVPLYIDNDPEGGGAATPSAAGGCAAGNTIGASNPSGIITVPSNGSQWVKGTVSVGGWACDTISGISEIRTYYSADGGAWQPLCTNGAWVGAWSVSQTNCSLNTAGFAQGTSLRFRTWSQDLAGNSRWSNAISDTVRVDNTAPTMTAAKWFALAPAAKPISDGTGWTNTRSAEARWAPASDGAGSGVQTVEWIYAPDMEGSGSGSCSAQTGSTAPTTTTITFAEDRRDECRQGLHRLSFRATDYTGHTGPWLTSDFRYDSDPTQEAREMPWSRNQAGAPLEAQHLRPMNLTANPKAWTTINNFWLQWDNPTYNGITEAPTDHARWQVAGSPAQTLAGCTGSGEACALNFTVNGPGPNNVCVTLVDAAGNADKELSVCDTVNWADNSCIRP